MVVVCDVTNGNGCVTDASTGGRGSGIAAVQGAAERLVNNGDCIIIMAVDLTTDPIEPKMILVEAKNNYVERLEGVRHVQQIH